jgi:hypothetical protein
MNDYFESRTTVTDSGCWEWSLFRNARGYGQAKMAAVQNRPIGAHRLSYLLHVGPIPDGMTVDHLCFNPPCVNPEHLRLLSHSENAGHQLDAYKTHCVNGHEFTPENTRIREEKNGRRSCKACHRDGERVNRQRRMADVPRLGPARGERAHSARLTEADVRAIRSRHGGGETVSGLAREYGISRGAVQGVIYGRTWTHVRDAAEVQASQDRHPSGKAIR